MCQFPLFFIMLKHVDKVKIPKINSSPSVFSLPLKENESGRRAAAHHSRATQRGDREGPPPAMGEQEAGVKYKDPASNLPFTRKTRWPSFSLKSKRAEQHLFLMPILTSESLNVRRPSEPERQTGSQEVISSWATQRAPTVHQKPPLQRAVSRGPQRLSSASFEL